MGVKLGLSYKGHVKGTKQIEGVSEQGAYENV
jgi:hypothetical protein